MTWEKFFTLLFFCSIIFSSSSQILFATVPRVTVIEEWDGEMEEFQVMVRSTWQYKLLGFTTMCGFPSVLITILPFIYFAEKELKKNVPRNTF